MCNERQRLGKSFPILHIICGNCLSSYLNCLAQVLYGCVTIYCESQCLQFSAFHCTPLLVLCSCQFQYKFKVSLSDQSYPPQSVRIYTSVCSLAS